jgi:hypothetical protein
MAGGAESSALTTEGKESFRATVWTPDPGKTALRIAAIEIFLHNLLHHRAKIAILSLKAVLIFQKEWLEVMKEHPVEDSALGMALAIDTCHGTDRGS